MRLTRQRSAVTAEPLDELASARLLHGDSFDVLDRLLVDRPESVDLVIADPPYFVGKADWDAPRAPHEVFVFHETWLSMCRDLLRPDGSLWVMGTNQSIYSVGSALQRLGMVVVNSVAWAKPNPRPLQSRTMFKHSHELLIWAKRSAEARPFFDYPRMRHLNGGTSAMGTVWSIAPANRGEKRHGRHPTQKPEALLERIVLSTSRPGAVVLDPFIGSGTTAVAAVRHSRRVIGIDQDADYLAIARRRVDEELNPGPGPQHIRDAA